MCDPRLVRPLLHSGRGSATSPSPLKVPWQTVHALASSLFLHFKRLGAILCIRVAGCHMSFWTSANAFVALGRCPLECWPEPLSQSSMATGTCVEAAYLHGLTSAMHFIMLLVKCMAEVHRMHFNDIVRVASCELGRFWLRDLSTIHLPSIGEWLWRRVSRPVQRGVSYDMSISENEESRTLPTYT